MLELYKDGQPIFYNMVNNAIKNNKLSHAYIIEVNDYDSDYLLVEAFVKLILCKNNVKKVSDLNCDKCEICRLVDEGNYPDVLVVEPDGKEIKKGQLLDLQKEFSYVTMCHVPNHTNSGMVFVHFF